MITESTASELRETGISIIGGVRWGTHFCSFYETKEDLLETLVPYFKAGLENKEFCLWIVSPALSVDEAKQALKQAVPDLERYLEAGDLEIHSHNDWYLRDGRWDPQRVLQSWSEKLGQMVGNGYAGSRGAGDGGWIQNDGKMVFCEYEKEVNRLIADQRSIILCTYPLTTSPSEQVFDIAHIHHAAVARRNGRWEMIELLDLKEAKAEIKRLNEELEQKVKRRTRQLARTNERLRAQIAERKLAEEAVKHSEDRIRLVIDKMPTMVWSLGPNGALDFVNQRWLDYTGISFRDALLEPNSTVHREDLPRVVEKWLKDMAAAQASEDELRLRRGDGEYRWFLVRTVPLFDEQGNILKWYGVSTDIEDRKRAEVAARDLVDAIPHQIWSAPADGSLDYCNARWRAYMGIGLEELQDDGWQSMLHPEDRDRVLKAWHESVANGTPYEQEERHRGVDGIYRWFLARGVPLRDTEGRIIRWYGTNTDIEDRKRVEEALRESETRFRQVAENISVVFWLSNPEATLLHYVSPAYETIWGRSCDSLYSEPKSWMDSVHPDDRESLAEDERMQATGGRYDHTYRIVRPDGSLRWIRGRAFPVRDESGKLIRVAGIAEDITQRKEAEERLERYTHLLQILSRRLFQVQEEERRHLARELHDEIGQTLTAAKINTEMLRSAMPPDARARLDENTAILDRLLQQTRQISLDLRPPLLDDLGLVPALRWYVDQQAERAGLAAKVSAEPLADDVPAHIQVACFRLAQEAITNVVRHAHASTLTVELSRANSALCFFVRDDGVGFDVAKAQARAERGATLGLLGMKERAALAGGSVRITSSLGKGATVEIFLPVDVAEGAIVSQGTGPSRETGDANIWTRK